MRADGRFVWGVSTASYQIEGAVAEDGRKPSIWDTWCRQGKVANGDTGDVACDHYHRYREDVDLMKVLGVGAYRFSIAWPRVLPDGRGAPNEAGLSFYDRLIDAVLEAGIEPWICLYHWDLPQALEDRGGWTNRDTAGWFADYALLAPHLEPYIQAGDLARICRPCDWFGLNHYGPIFAKRDERTVWGFAWGSAPPEATKSDIGWPIYPDMFGDELLELTKRYRLPVYVTENGCGGHDEPDNDGKIDDQRRITYLSAHISAMQQAMKKGADVRGYFVWSLLDNFEWGSGYQNRFGLVHVDFATQKRRPKASAEWYAQLIRSGRQSATPSSRAARR